MSNIQTFANTQNTQFAKLIAKLCLKHCSYIPASAPQPANFKQFQTDMYVHRVLYAYYKFASKHSVNQPFMQAYFVRMLRNKPQLLVNAANTPTAYIK